MICVETIGKIRRWHRVDKLSISEIARRLGASRKLEREMPMLLISSLSDNTCAALQPGHKQVDPIGPLEVGIYSIGRRTNQGTARDPAAHRRFLKP